MSQSLLPRRDAHHLGRAGSLVEPNSFDASESWRFTLRVVGAVWLSSPSGLLDFPREFPVVIVRPKPHAQSDLLEIIRAGDPLRFSFRMAKSRQQHSRENRDDRDDHQQFNQREGRDSNEAISYKLTIQCSLYGASEADTREEFLRIDRAFVLATEASNANWPGLPPSL